MLSKTAAQILHMQIEKFLSAFKYEDHELPIQRQCTLCFTNLRYSTVHCALEHLHLNHKHQMQYHGIKCPYVKHCKKSVQQEAFNNYNTTTNYRSTTAPTSTLIIPKFMQIMVTQEENDKTITYYKLSHTDDSQGYVPIDFKIHASRSMCIRCMRMHTSTFVSKGAMLCTKCNEPFKIVCGSCNALVHNTEQEQQDCDISFRKEVASADIKAKELLGNEKPPLHKITLELSTSDNHVKMPPIQQQFPHANSCIPLVPLTQVAVNNLQPPNQQAANWNQSLYEWDSLL